MNIYQVTFLGKTWNVEASNPKVAIKRVIQRTDIKLKDNRTMSLHVRLVAKNKTLKEYKDD